MKPCSRPGLRGSCSPWTLTICWNWPGGRAGRLKSFPKWAISSRGGPAVPRASRGQRHQARPPVRRTGFRGRAHPWSRTRRSSCGSWWTSPARRVSPAINDPTTAVLAIDQVHHLLRRVGRRRLDTGEVRDADGILRVLYRTPDWDDFVLLGVAEIRQYGAESLQVVRRLRAMLENLLGLVPPARQDILREQLRLLQSGVQRTFSDPENASAPTPPTSRASADLTTADRRRRVDFTSLPHRAMPSSHWTKVQ